MCCKTIFMTKLSNIDSRSSTGAQLRLIIALSQHSEEFCNTFRSKADIDRAYRDFMSRGPAISRAKSVTAMSGCSMSQTRSKAVVEVLGIA
jgi:hypothetical protein